VPQRIGSHSLGEFPLAVVRIECERCGRAGSCRRDGLMARLAPTWPCPICSWNWRNASAGGTSRSPAARGRGPRRRGFELARVCVGDRVEAKLMGHSQPVLGHVATVTRGIGVSDAEAGAQELPNVDPVYTWVTPAQRVPRLHRLPSVRLRQGEKSRQRTWDLRPTDAWRRPRRGVRRYFLSSVPVSASAMA
jgi:hypothetical protein